MKSRKISIIVALCGAFALTGCSDKKAVKKSDAPTETMQNNDIAEESRLVDTEANNTAPMDEESNEDNSALTWTDGEYIADSARELETASAEEMEKIDELTDALMYNDDARVRSLIETLINVNAKDHYGNTALMNAIYNDIDIIKLLIQAGADANAKNNNGFTALMWAAKNNTIDKVRLLIEAGADVNASNHDGNTALMMTAEKNATDAARLLIDAGANVNATDYNGKTALMFAEERNAKENDSEDMIQLLKSAGAFVQERRKAGKYYIGDKGPGGGIVFFYSEKGFAVKDSDDASPVICHYLECSPEELGEMTWCPCSSYKGGWCDINTTDGLGAGKLNTAHIVNHSHTEPLTPSNCAAYACSQYSTETTKEGEWYLPSYRELNSIYENLRKSGMITSDYFYWSSSQYDNNRGDAWHKNFKNGYKCGGQDGKDMHYSVRAVRAF